jgi:hypothetical protein
MASWIPSTQPAVGDKIPVGFGQAFGALTSYTPTLTGGWTTGNGTLSGGYSQVDKWVYVEAQFQFGTTSAAAAAAPILSLPVTGATGFLQGGLFRGLFFDSSASITYATIPLALSGSYIHSFSPGTNGLTVTPSTTVPFTWASGDYIRFTGLYQAA